MEITRRGHEACDVADVYRVVRLADEKVNVKETQSPESLHERYVIIGLGHWVLGKDSGTDDGRPMLGSTLFYLGRSARMGRPLQRGVGGHRVSQRGLTEVSHVVSRASSEKVTRSWFFRRLCAPSLLTKTFASRGSNDLMATRPDWPSRGVSPRLSIWSFRWANLVEFCFLDLWSPCCAS